jgi:hypothetical protein
MLEGALPVSAVASAFNATIRISQVVYELKAVGEQTRDLLDTTNHISTSLQVVRNLRRQKSGYLDGIEKKWIDDVVMNIEKTLGKVATLIEPARADMQTNFGKVGLINKGLFVLRDSPKVGTHLGRLGIASQSLNTAMNILCAKEARAGPYPVGGSPLLKMEGGGNVRNDAKLPSYGESEFLNRRRLLSVRKGPVMTDPPSAILDLDEEQPATSFNTQKLNDGLIVGAPVIAVAEVTPLESPQWDPLTDSDGLQVCDGWESPTRPWRTQQANQELQDQQWQGQHRPRSQWEDQHRNSLSQDLQHDQQWRVRPPFDSDARPNSTSFDPLSRCESRSSATGVGAPSDERQRPRSTGRARGRAWLKFQSER